jgi:hypothetical protein
VGNHGELVIKMNIHVVMTLAAGEAIGEYGVVDDVGGADVNGCTV